MRPLKEIKADLEKAQSEYEEARKHYKELTAPENKLRPVKMKDIRPAHNELVRTRDLVRELEKELSKASERAKQ
jgi:hypothetical protein